MRKLNQTYNPKSDAARHDLVAAQWNLLNKAVDTIIDQDERIEKLERNQAAIMKILKTLEVKTNSDKHGSV